MFDNLEALPPDPILGLSAAFKKDNRDHKIDLGVGVYKDEAGRTPVMRAIKAARTPKVISGRSVSSPSTAVSPVWCWAMIIPPSGTSG